MSSSELKGDRKFVEYQHNLNVREMYERALRVRNKGSETRADELSHYGAAVKE